MLSKTKETFRVLFSFFDLQSRLTRTMQPTLLVLGFSIRGTSTVLVHSYDIAHSSSSTRPKEVR